MADRRNVTASVSTTRFVEGSHLFKISGYSLLLENKSSASIQSTPFKVGGYTWAINYRPQFYYGPQSSVYVELLSEGVTAVAKFKFYLLNKSGNYVPMIEPLDRDHGHDHDHVLTFGEKGVQMGHDMFVKNGDMLPYLHDDNFTIKCTLHVLTSSVEHVCERVCREEDPWKLSYDLGKLLDSGEGSDVLFDVKGERFRAHKCILAARSQYFRSQFFGPLRKSEPFVEIIKIENMDPTVVRALLQYIYTNSFPEMKKFNNIDNVNSVAHQNSRYVLIQNLISVADQYLIDHLKSICEELLRNEISDINVSAFLAVAEKHNCYALKFACLDHLSDPGPLAIAMLTDEFSQMALDCPAVLNEIKEIVGHKTLERALSEFQESLGLVSESTCKTD